MAHAKTTPAQIAAQLTAGAVVCGLVYQSLYKKKPEEKQQQAAPQAADASTSPSVIAALDAEARNTAGKVWGLDPPGGRAQGSSGQR